MTHDTEARDVTDDDVEQPDDGTTSPEEEAPSHEPTPRSSAWIAWTIAAALAVVAAVAVVQWRSLADPAAAVDAARAAAVDYVEVLSTWDAGDGLEPTYAGLVSGATDAFAPEVDDVFGDEQREQLVAVEAVSQGTIDGVLTGDLDDGSVDVVVVVEQVVVTGPTADPVARTERVAMLRMVREGDRWLVDDLEMLSELQVAEEDPS